MEGHDITCRIIENASYRICSNVKKLFSVDGKTIAGLQGIIE